MKAAPDEADLLRSGHLLFNPALDSVPVGEPRPEVAGRSRWPAPLRGAAYHGLAGRFVRLVEPHTEADPVALLFQFLGFFGVSVGRGVGFSIGATWHGLNEYLGLIGDTGTGRKGTSFEEVRSAFEIADPDFIRHRLKRGGLASGEGIKYHVRDPRPDDDPKKSDAGVTDKRLIVFEPELAAVLKKAAKDGNTLSPTIREAWESGNLCNLTVKDSVVATGAHIGIIAHSTEDELRDLLRSTDVSNGFVNRILWIAVRKSKDLPRGGAPETAALQALSAELRATIGFARGAGEIAFDARAANLWDGEYLKLNLPIPGALGHAVARGAAHVRRLAAIYACLDETSAISPAHLLAALECWRYAADTCRMVFGGSTGDTKADQILDRLRDRPDGMTKTEITEAFHNKGLEGINRALQRLEEDWGKIVRRKDAVDPAKPHRTAERFFLSEAAK